MTDNARATEQFTLSIEFYLYILIKEIYILLFDVYSSLWLSSSPDKKTYSSASCMMSFKSF